MIQLDIDNELQRLDQQLQQVQGADYHRLKRRLERVRKQQKGDIQLLAAAIDASIAKKQWRHENKPVTRPDTSLPIYQSQAVIKQALLENQVVIVCGETGSGKTTQLPLYCLDVGRGIDGLIGHTQPRRLAARTVSRRIADELQCELGTTVGFRIRHQDVTAEEGYIKLMTDGILLSEMQQDRFLNAYDTLIIDEAHERSLNIDFILGYLKQLLPKRPGLKVIVTSATIDVDRFSTHFDDAPIVEVPGKTYPVDVLYRPLEETDEKEQEQEREQHILEAVRELSGFDMGDILVFLEGEGEIHETDRFLLKQRLPDTDILPLYSRLSSARQGKIFAPHNRRHIVLATNVAETSLTIPGIRYVIDTGMARISRYSPRSKIQRLPIEKISRAAANQRKGRCGRTSEGICIRLYSEEDFENRPAYTEPEIVRTNLASVILQMKLLRLGDIRDFPFIEPPDEKLVNDGLRLLQEINAIDKQGRLSRIGKTIARLPIEPRYARMLVAAVDYHCLSELLIIASALSIQDPRERPVDNAARADKMHAAYVDENSDFYWYLNFWRFYHQQRKKLSQNKLRKLCQQNFISYTRMREWLDIHRQLRHICTELGFNLNNQAASYQNIHCAILTGLPSHVACLTDKHEYTGARNTRSFIFPASSQFDKKPKWLVAAELVETSKLYARQVARIEPDWVIATARHLLKYSYSNIHWDMKSARVVAHEAVSLYGMTLSAQRVVNYGKLKPADARPLFIRHALVEGQFESNAAFFQHNIELMQQVQNVETRTRRPDLLNEEEVFNFYMNKLPAEVYDGHSFHSWLHKLDKETTQDLFMQQSDMLLDTIDDELEQLYPDTLKANRLSLPLEYRFEPGSQDDGVNVDLPLEVLAQFSETQFDYLVPGLLNEKIVQLLKSLPKPIRKQLVPIPDTAAECAGQIQNLDIPLTRNLAGYLFRSRGIKIEDKDWSMSSLPDHLKINFRVFDANNNMVAQGRELSRLHQELSDKADKAFNDAVVASLDRQEIHDWEFGTLPVSEQVTAGDTTLTVYPALVEEEGKVYRDAFDSRETAEYYFRYGLRALFRNVLSKDLKYLRKNLRDIEQLALLYSAIGSKQDLIESIVNNVIDESFLFDNKVIREQEQFKSLLAHGKDRLLLNAEQICRLLQQILTAYNRLMTRLQEPDIASHEHAVNDIEDQLQYLFYNGFIDDMPWSRLQEYPRYLDSIARRLEKLEYSLEKDKKNTLQIAGHWNRIKQLVDNAYATGDYPVILDEYRWMLEELRISLFTQELKTRFPVSLKRLDKKWTALQQLGK